jgi:cellulose synthase/poly-beta-1,6-N-acetylglucosamine synthase-like glycosyltransferase
MSIERSIEHVVVVALAAAVLAMLWFLVVSPRQRPRRPAASVSVLRQALTPLLAIGPAVVGLAAYQRASAADAINAINAMNAVNAVGGPADLREGLAAPSMYAAGALVWVATLPWLALAGRWRAAAHASWSLGATAGLAYVGAMAVWTVGSGLGAVALAGAWLLWLLEVAAVVLFLSYGYEIHDTLGSVRWDRRWASGAVAGGSVAGGSVAGGSVAGGVGRGSGERARARAGVRSPASSSASSAAYSAAYQSAGTVTAHRDAPFVSIHVPSHNEPPEMVIETLRSLLALDYPAFEILVLDNNTTDDRLCAPVQRFCAEHPQRLHFHRLLDWPGYKSGALNYGLTQSDPRAELIAVVDADYQVQPDWLRAVAPVFQDPSVGFVQTPQHYRQWQHNQYLRSLYYSYDYFFTVSQPSRDERNAAIFGGTMGVIRRAALEAVGGWDEWCITEDAEVSLRLLAAGWSGHHLDQPFGSGIMPLTFEALKRQRFRWCFGGMQILRQHWRELLPWRRDSRLTLAQRVGYLVGGVQWFGDLLGLVFGLILVASLLDLALGGGHIVRRLGGLLLLAVPGLAVLGIVRALAGMKAAQADARWRDAAGAFAIWLSLGWVVALASVRGLVEREGVFLRTPKRRGDVSWVDGVRANLVEVGLASLALGAIVTASVAAPGWVTTLLTGLLVLPLVGWLSAPVHSLAALRAELTPQLSDRRDREDGLAWWRPRARWSLASLLGAAAIGAIVYAVVQPTSVELPARAPVSVLPVPRVGSLIPATGPATEPFTEATAGALGGTAGGSPTAGAGDPTQPRSTAGSTPAGPGAAPTAPVQLPGPTPGRPTAAPTGAAPTGTLPGATQPGVTRPGQGRPTAPPGSPTTRDTPPRPTHSGPGRP